MQTHLLLLANYNALMNQKICTSIADVADDELWQDKGAFFGSILGTLNHIMTGIAFSKPFSQLLLHVFNHQTHHRGQVTTLLSQMNIDIGETDLLMLIND